MLPPVFGIPCTGEDRIRIEDIRLRALRADCRPLGEWSPRRLGTPDRHSFREIPMPPVMGLRSGGVNMLIRRGLCIICWDKRGESVTSTAEIRPCRKPGGHP